jgi:UDP-N-acetylglucosamine--N-acetylmuramyl-(pentapeptide) pyrophosphoryl-undecaprenol N-acetylglucosamine transferase
VPFPFAADDHQTSNALAVVERGGGVMVADHELKSGRPARLLGELLRHRDVLERMGRSARALGRPDSTRAIADDLLACLEAR